MSSSSEGLRDERRICRIHFSMRITDVAYETTCHGRRSSPSDSLIGRRHGDDGETEVHDDRCPWGLVGSGRQAGQRAPGDLSGEGVEVCRVVISCGELSELVRGETRYDDPKRVRNAGTWQHRSRRPPMHPRCGVGVHENGSRPFRRHVPRRCARRGAVCACRSTSALLRSGIVCVQCEEV